MILDVGIFCRGQKIAHLRILAKTSFRGPPCISASFRAPRSAQIPEREGDIRGPTNSRHASSDNGLQCAASPRQAWVGGRNNCSRCALAVVTTERHAEWLWEGLRHATEQKWPPREVAVAAG